MAESQRSLLTGNRTALPIEKKMGIISAISGLARIQQASSALKLPTIAAEQLAMTPERTGAARVTLFSRAW